MKFKKKYRTWKDIDNAEILDVVEKQLIILQKKISMLSNYNVEEILPIIHRIGILSFILIYLMKNEPNNNMLDMKKKKLNMHLDKMLGLFK